MQLRPPPFQCRRLDAEVIGAAEKGLYFGNEHAEIKGLCNKIVAPHIHGHDNIHIVGHGREKHHRHLTFLPDELAPVVAVIEGEGNVHQHQLGIVLMKFLQHIMEILCAGGLQSPGANVAANLLSDGVVIFHDKDTIHNQSPAQNVSYFTALLQHKKPNLQKVKLDLIKSTKCGKKIKMFC